MRYWLFFFTKLVLAAAVLALLWRIIESFLPPEQQFLYMYQPRFPYDITWTFALCLFFLLCCGVLYLILLDQRYRCRHCLRRLRMPLEKGSWSHILEEGYPRIEYICPYGHGTLYIPETKLLGAGEAEWVSHADFWEELLASDQLK